MPLQRKAFRLTHRCACPWVGKSAAKIRLLFQLVKLRVYPPLKLILFNADFVLGKACRRVSQPKRSPSGAEGSGQDTGRNRGNETSADVPEGLRRHVRRRDTRRGGDYPFATLGTIHIGRVISEMMPFGVVPIGTTLFCHCSPHGLCPRLCLSSPYRDFYRSQKRECISIARNATRTPRHCATQNRQRVSIRNIQAPSGRNPIMTD